MEYIEQVEIRYYKEVNPNAKKFHNQYKYAYGTKIVFHDCLPGKAWLEAHYQDIIPEPSFELLVDGKSVANINGNYKRGMIKQLIKANK